MSRPTSLVYDPLTTDLADFGLREIDMALDLLAAYSAVKRAGGVRWLGDGVRVHFNMNSGYVFLADDDYNVGMLDHAGQLRQFHSCPECGCEGFDDDLRESGDACCAAYLDAINQGER